MSHACQMNFNLSNIDTCYFLTRAVLEVRGTRDPLKNILTLRKNNSTDRRSSMLARLCECKEDLGYGNRFSCLIVTNYPEVVRRTVDSSVALMGQRL
jgi:hypothetical protein